MGGSRISEKSWLLMITCLLNLVDISGDGWWFLVVFLAVAPKILIVGPKSTSEALGAPVSNENIGLQDLLQIYKS